MPNADPTPAALAALHDPLVIALSLMERTIKDSMEEWTPALESATEAAYTACAALLVAARHGAGDTARLDWLSNAARINDLTFAPPDDEPGQFIAYLGGAFSATGESFAYCSTLRDAIDAARAAHPEVEK